MLTPGTDASKKTAVEKLTLTVRSWELTCLVLLLTLHPIIAPDFWWQVARGRAVWEGHFSPSQSLLADHPLLDADWLSGLPWYLLFANVGPSIMSCGLAIAVVILANFIATAVGSRMDFRQTQIVLIFFGFAAARNSWSPTPAFIDNCGVFAIWNLAGNLRRNSRRISNVFFLLLCELIWTTFATTPVLGLFVTFLRLNLSGRNEPQSPSPQYQFVLISLMSLVGSATPRGFLTLWDSVRVLFPWTSADLGTLAMAGILPTFRWPPTAEFAAFVILCLLHVTLLVRKSSAGHSPGLRDIGFLSIVMLIAGSSTANMGLAAMLLMLATIELSPYKAHHATATGSAETVRPPALLRYLLPLASAVYAILVGGGFWPGSQSRLGWGLSPQLEPALVEDTMKGFKLDGTGYCSGVREAGLLAWLRPGLIRPADVPERALLSGRLPEHVRIGWDLAHGWRDQHRRSDGSWGGWLKPLRERRTRLLLISSDELATIRALESSLWKPLAIDTPSVPYGLLGDPSISRRMRDVQSLLELVDLGEWTFPIPAATGVGSHFDSWGWLIGQHDVRNDCRQARTLAAMNRYIAALKVLKYGLQRRDRQARHEFREIQLSLAYRDYLATGQASVWRLSVYRESGGDPVVLRRINPAGKSLFSSLPKSFVTAVSAYGRNDLDSAKKALSENQAESLFALSQISLEEGNPQRASSLLKDLVARFPKSTESEVALNVLAQFSK